MKPKHIVSKSGSYEYWELNGRYHRKDGPAYIEYENGRIAGEEWYRNGYFYREGGPALIKYENGEPIREEWYLNRLHRENGPAYIEYEDGKVIRELWYDNGLWHREDGPAYVSYDECRIIEEWYTNGVQLTVENFTCLEIVTRMKAWSLFKPHEIIEMMKGRYFEN